MGSHYMHRVADGSDVSGAAEERAVPHRKRPNLEYKLSRADVRHLCEEKKWIELARRMMTSTPTVPTLDDDGERCLVADLLIRLDYAGVPTNVMISIVSLSRNRHRRPAPQFWPNSMPVTRQAAERSAEKCRSKARDVHLLVLSNFLAICTLKRAKQDIVRLLTAILYLSSDEGTVEKFLCLIFDDCLFKGKGNDTAEARETTHSSFELSCIRRGESSEKEDRYGQVDASDTFIIVGTHLGTDKSIVIRRGEFVASKISDSAKWVENSLAVTVVPTVVSGIDSAGRFVKGKIPPAEEPIIDRRTGVVTRTYTDAARRCTGGIRDTAQFAASGIRDVSTNAVRAVSSKIGEDEIGEHFVAEKEKRDLLAAAGTVGLATVGAVAIVGEAIVGTSRAVVRKGAYVCSDIVRHRHGDDAGRILEDVIESTGNVIQLHQTSFQAKSFTKAVAKNTGKSLQIG